MASEATYFSDASLAWQHWNLTDFIYRSEYLLRFAQFLEKDSTDLAKVVKYHLNCARTLIAEPLLLAGPTGETNELYTTGRGVTVIAQMQMENGALPAVMAQLSAALIAGNSVVICSDDTVLRACLSAAFEENCFPVNLVQVIAADLFHPILAHDVRQVGMIGDRQDARRVNLALVQRSGVIINPVIETDLDMLPVAHDSALVLRFVTERTRTINITAIGGNASLLEMGSANH
ncbi:1-pyrroline-5-carboxylate dehydrogenase [Vibrio mangrovi]|uniref:1-pyrroline-5-carboxylate dehydrogenase n=1 Tax=Vibrio mangrovi TaxID=474394 RepID=A0A1Y6IZ11_9VIBR|nr:1-pyrroline-5-carboxylate dehydrogenase [Vibrio mangrovi]MDW6004968.1 1-pyrroline-5-carboxylate dehydrogenase [Vibrio mangrovi]SMS01732.1 bifunctional proline dehydrogenase/pyrroline-5-carboxylate dehydrogenase [Vibrio mangrovi]